MIDHLRRFIFALLVFIIAVLVFALWRSGQPGYGLLDLLHGNGPGGGKFTAPVESKIKAADVPLLSQLDEEYSKLVASVLPSVVSVNTTTVVEKQLVQQFFGFNISRGMVQVPQAGLGSGAIISKEGHVISNFHVIEGAKEVKVTLNDNKTYTARVLYADGARDIALLKIESDKKDFPALAFADSGKARVGQIVFAVGNPFGLSGTVTQGILSARNRHINDASMDYLQTDTVINPGNSGGPLVNLRGEILGINVAIYRGDQTVNSWQGIGLAIPSNDAKSVVDAALSNKTQGKGGNGYMGLEVNQESVRINTGEGAGTIGVLIIRVADKSPAQIAGLIPGDVVTGFNGRPVRSAADLLTLIRTSSAGTKAKLTVWRNGEIGNVDCELGTPPPHSFGL